MKVIGPWLSEPKGKPRTNDLPKRGVVSGGMSSPGWGEGIHSITTGNSRTNMPRCGRQNAVLCTRRRPGRNVIEVNTALAHRGAANGQCQQEKRLKVGARITKPLTQNQFSLYTWEPLK